MVGNVAPEPGLEKDLGSGDTTTDVTYTTTWGKTRLSSGGGENGPTSSTINGGASGSVDEIAGGVDHLGSSQDRM